MEAAGDVAVRSSAYMLEQSRKKNAVVLMAAREIQPVSWLAESSSV